jgi:two-component system, NtrC family, sensor histidine kinase HydH
MLSPAAYVLIGMTALVAALISVLVFAVLRFVAAAREARQPRLGRETALMSAALQDAVDRLRSQERATAARAEASERLSGEIISSLTAGLLVVALRGDVRILNPAGRRMLALPEAAPPEAVRDSLRQLGIADIVDECLRTAAPVVRRSVSLPLRDRAASHLGLTVSPLFDDRGALTGAICLFTDLTEIKELEAQLRLKDSLATVGELTAGIAHEFRNGLATIHGYSKLFDLRSLPEAYRQYVEGIRSEAESLSQVVTNFLNFARPAELTLTRVDLRALCERAVEEIRSDTRALGGDVELRGDFAAVDGDEVLLRQAFSNLLRNAFESCAGASIAPRIAVVSEIDRSGRMLRLSVNDNGPGIPVTVRDRIFQPFFTSKRNGTGLGLALVQKIIVFHNGRISAGASPDGGASLQISLPVGG